MPSPSESIPVAVIWLASGKSAPFQALTNPSTTVETRLSVAMKSTSLPLILIVNVSPRFRRGRRDLHDLSNGHRVASEYQVGHICSWR